MKTIFIAALLALTTGCVGQSSTLVNDKGEKRYCYKSASGVFSNIGATREFNRCLNDAGTAGFKRLDE